MIALLTKEILLKIKEIDEVIDMSESSNHRDLLLFYKNNLRNEVYQKKKRIKRQIFWDSATGLACEKALDSVTEASARIVEDSRTLSSAEIQVDKYIEGMSASVKGHKDNPEKPRWSIGYNQLESIRRTMPFCDLVISMKWQYLKNLTFRVRPHLIANNKTVDRYLMHHDSGQFSLYDEDRAEANRACIIFKNLKS